ncbi:hypothetical protein [Methylopila sp. Yamaguchi]|uniref:hypothetical protein n=1 Tax=Methylopila sp. Yamaguchi TaxID=1437817 RepID=UPI000CB70EE0|nr:hypothetical protein [Methylopila sp. Yamaguchi]GBD49128.1 hypothetical protein METY_2341 [Methylopila sp. Yamaguchi]
MTKAAVETPDPWDDYGGRVDGLSSRACLSVASAAALFAAIYAAWSLYETAFYRRALPEALRTTGLVYAGRDFNPLLLFVPLRPEGCGAALHNLDRGTTAAIANAGLSFFADQLRSRAPSANEWRPWKETPIDDERADGLLGRGLGCIGMTRSLRTSIFRAVGRPGAYFTRGGGSMLLVVPDLDLVVMAYDN